MDLPNSFCRLSRASIDMLRTKYASTELFQWHMLYRTLALLETIHNTIAAMTSGRSHKVETMIESLKPNAWTDVHTTNFILENLESILEHLSVTTRRQLAEQLDGMIPYGYMDAKISIAVSILDFISGSGDFDVTGFTHTRQLLSQTQWMNQFRACSSPARAGDILRLWGFSFWNGTQRAGSSWTEGTTDVNTWMDVVLARLNEYNVCTTWKLSILTC